MILVLEIEPRSAWRKLLLAGHVRFLKSTVRFDSYTLDAPLHKGILCRKLSVLDPFDCAGMHASFVGHQLKVPCDKQVHTVVLRKLLWKEDEERLVEGHSMRDGFACEMRTGVNLLVADEDFESAI